MINKINIKKLVTFLLAFIIYISTLYILSQINICQEKYDSENKIIEEVKQAKELSLEKEHQEELKEQYNDCLASEYSNDELTTSLESKINELNTFLSNYRVSVAYYDPLTKYSYNYNQDTVYYAASTIKMLDAIYIYTKASEGLINLDDTVLYEKRDKQGASNMMQNYKIGDQVSLRDLVKYAITVSDNTAHAMLIKYIGYQNLKSYGSSLGAIYTLNTGDNFGHITASDSITYLLKLYNYINTNSELSNELKSYFVNSDQNYLSFNILSSVIFSPYNVRFVFH